jgi:hypothetical protein
MDDIKDRECCIIPGIISTNEYVNTQSNEAFVNNHIQIKSANELNVPAN